MLKITIEDSADEFRFRLEGRLCGPWVGELRQCWRTAASTTSGRRTIADLHEVDYVDSPGQVLLAEMHHAGVRLVAVTPLIQSVLEEISGTSWCGTVEDESPRATHVLRSDHAGGDSGAV